MDGKRICKRGTSKEGLNHCFESLNQGKVNISVLTMNYGAVKLFKN